MGHLSLKVPMRITIKTVQDSIDTAVLNHQDMEVPRHPLQVAVVMERVVPRIHRNVNLIQMVDQGHRLRCHPVMKDVRNVPLATNKKSVLSNTLKVNQVIN